MRTSSPSSSSTRSAFAHVCRACPYCWLRVVMDGVGIPGVRVPSAICRRSSAASRTYALGSDSSLIDTLVPYSIGNIANRNASTLVEIRRGINSALTSETVGVVTGPENRAEPESRTGHDLDLLLVDGAERCLWIVSRHGDYRRPRPGHAGGRGVPRLGPGHRGHHRRGAAGHGAAHAGPVLRPDRG